MLACKQWFKLFFKIIHKSLKRWINGDLEWSVLKPGSTPGGQREVVPTPQGSYRKRGCVLVVRPLHGEEDRNRTLNVDSVLGFQKAVPHLKITHTQETAFPEHKVCVQGKFSCNFSLDWIYAKISKPEPFQRTFRLEHVTEQLYYFEPTCISSASLSLSGWEHVGGSSLEEHKT